MPQAYQSLYDSVEADLSAVEAYVDSLEVAPGASTRFGTELTVASGNRGAELLEPQVLGAVRLFLDRLEEIGVEGVSVQISDPLLTQSYPNSGAYLDFYLQVADEVRRRGLTLIVETGPVFPDPQYSNVRFDWSGLSAESYFGMRREQLGLIARTIQPDYLSIGNEPDTERLLTGVGFGLSDYLDYLRGVIADLGHLEQVRLGAGSGSWDDPAYVMAFLEEPGLDFIDIHLYPLTNGRVDYVQRAAEWAGMAEANGKEVIVGEAWLYKATAEELQTGISYQQALARDVFSFWTPLDVRYILATARLARATGIDHVSYFWSGFFFSYLEADDGWLNATDVELYQELRRLQAANILSGSLTTTGRAYQELLSR